MKETLNLWQRCEALGPMEDQGVSLYRTDSGDYRIFIDRATVFHVHQDGTIGDYCRAWLAESILQRFEAITKQGGTVLNKGNVVKQVERACKEIPPCTPINDKVPTSKEIQEVAEYLSKTTSERFKDLGLTVKWKSLNQPFKQMRWRVYWVSPTYGIGIADELLLEIRRDFEGPFNATYYATWKGVCERIGFTPELPTPESLTEPTYIVEAPKPTEPTQEQLKALVQYIRSVRTFLKSQKIEVTELEETTGDTGLRLRLIEPPMLAVIEEQTTDLIEYRCNMPFDELCRLIGFKAKESEVVESPKEFVSIPVGEYFDARASIEQVKEAFGKLSEAFAAISKMYTPEP